MTSKVLPPDLPSGDARVLIKSILNKYEWTQLELSQKLNITPFTISKWMTGKHKPTLKNLRLLNKIFITGTEQIAKPEEPKDDSEHLTIPVLRSLPIGAIENHNLYGSCKLPKWLLQSNAPCFMIQLNNNDLEPKFNNGDYLIVRNPPQYSIGETILRIVENKLNATRITSNTMGKIDNAAILGSVIANLSIIREVY